MIIFEAIEAAPVAKINDIFIRRVPGLMSRAET